MVSVNIIDSLVHDKGSVLYFLFLTCLPGTMTIMQFIPELEIGNYLVKVLPMILSSKATKSTNLHIKSTFLINV
jgi:hypothetical protein